VPAPWRLNRKDDAKRLVVIQATAAIYAGRPEITSEEMGAELKRLRHEPPRGGVKWGISSVRVLVEKARGLGLIKQTASDIPDCPSLEGAQP